MLALDLSNILSKLYDISLNKKKQSKANNKENMNLVFSLCEQLVNEENVTSDSVLLIRKRLKAIYKNVSTIFKGSLQEDELGVLMRAISSARILYWFKLFEKPPIRDYNLFINEHEKGNKKIAEYYSYDRFICPYKATRWTSSLKGAIEMVIRYENHYSKEDVMMILKEFCLEDIADLGVVISKY